MNLKTAYILLVLVVALITIPLFWLVIQANESVPFLIPIIIIGSGVIAYVISRKTRYKSH